MKSAMQNLFAYTEPTGPYPGFAALNRKGAEVTRTVRSPGEKGQRLAELVLPRQVLRDLAAALCRDDLANTG